MFKKLLSLFVGVLLVVSVLITALVATGNHSLLGLDSLFNNIPNQNNTDNDNSTDNPGNNTGTNPDKEPSKGPKLTCYDFIDQSLQADGFTYLNGANWSRGPKNQFVFDLSKLWFSFLDYRNAHVVPENWHTEDYYRFVYQRYVHDKKELHFMPRSENTPNNNLGTTARLSEPNNMFYEFIPWMNYYVDKFAQSGCSIEDLSEETLLGSYKSTLSKATAEDVESVFDRKSTDGVIRYFADVHKLGNIEDHPRYREIKTLEEYDSLHMNNDWEQMYYFIVTYKDFSKRTYETTRYVQAGALNHFVKDVLYEYTVWNQEVKMTPTLGAYFIYVDNPNRQFEYFYKNSRGVDATRNLLTYKTPYESTLLHSNVDDINSKFITPLFNEDPWHQIRYFAEGILLVNPDLKFAPDFPTYYTRPFNPEWQKRLGLKEFFDEKYGYTVDNIKYH
jgi:hypothetical protein